MNLEPAPARTELIDDRKLFTLPWIKWFNLLVGKINSFSATPGPKGDKGDSGVAGANGIDGIDGIDGTNGTSGINGTNGADGIPTTVTDTSTVDLTLTGSQLSSETIGLTGTTTFVSN